MGRHTRKVAFALLALVMAAAAQAVWRQWPLTLGLLVVLGGLEAAVLSQRINTKLDQLTAAQSAVARNGRRTLAATKSTAESLEGMRHETQRYADASGRQHATIDHRMVMLDKKRAQQTTDLATAVRTVAEQLDGLHTEVRELQTATSDLRAQASELSAHTTALLTETRQTRQALNGLRPKSQPRPTTSAVPGQDSILKLVDNSSAPSVNLVLHAFTPTQMFAGVRTALLAGVEAAAQSDRPLRLLILTGGDRDPGRARAELAAWVTKETGRADVAERLSITTQTHPEKPGYHREDVWIATYWTTAVALQQAVAAGMFSPERVMYLVQDWEPGFMAWGTEHALARETYRAGFRLVVNSASLARYVALQTGLEVPSDHIFSPQVDVQRLHDAAASWTAGDPDRPRVLAYLRPSKPRNLATMTLDTLRLWGDQLPPSVRPIVHLAGEDVTHIDLGPKLDVVMAGKTDLETYYELLTRTDVGLALMFSPHPSHLPLELPMAGVPTVTNALDDVRRPWVPGLRVASASPPHLAEALAGAWQESLALVRHTPQPPPSDLGGELDAAVRAVLEGLV